MYGPGRPFMALNSKAESSTITGPSIYSSSFSK